MPVKYDPSGHERHRKKVAEDAARKSIPFSELFTDDFMKAHTKFDTFAVMLESSGLELPQGDEWDAFVRDSTPFESWQVMLQTANAERVRRMLNS
jgi:hypothetical protein